jgi:hypothetical protein
MNKAKKIDKENDSTNLSKFYNDSQIKYKVSP